MLASTELTKEQVLFKSKDILKKSNETQSELT